MSNLSQAALRGDTEAMFRLSAAFAFGFEGMPMDANDAMHWLNKAAKAGHPTAGLVLQDIGQMVNVSGGKPQSSGRDLCLSSGDTKTIVLPGGAEMEMIYCAPGSFIMGSPENEFRRYDDEIQHKVTLTRGFWLGKYPVTQAQWKSVMGSNPSLSNKGYNYPVDCVSWDDCNDFIEKINSQSNLNARFPTEAEWEYACRAGSRGAYSGTGDLDEMGWYYDNRDGKTHPVGEKVSNGWGFYDMHGNVEEWCADWYGSYPTKSVTDSKGPASGGKRVLRGGCYDIDAWHCRSARRGSLGPAYSNSYLGFRLCCSAGSHE